MAVVGLAQNWDPASITDTIDLGSHAEWDDAAVRDRGRDVALIGVEAASGLAGEVRVGRRGLRRVVSVTASLALLLFVGVSVAGADGAAGAWRRTRRSAASYAEAPIVGMASAVRPGLAAARHAVRGRGDAAPRCCSSR